MHHVISEHVGKTDGFNHGHSNSVQMEHEIFLNNLFLLSAIHFWNMDKCY